MVPSGTWITIQHREKRSSKSIAGRNEHFDRISHVKVVTCQRDLLSTTRKLFLHTQHHVAGLLEQGERVGIAGLPDIAGRCDLRGRIGPAPGRGLACVEWADCCDACDGRDGCDGCDGRDGCDRCDGRHDRG